MSTMRSAWRARAEPFHRVLSRVSDWDASTPCEGWTTRDVVDHVITTQGEFLAMHDLGAASTAPGTSPLERWRAHDQHVEALLTAPEVAGREWAGYFGPTTIAHTLVHFYGTDLLVHRWDVAQSQDIDAQLDDAELEEIDAAMTSFGDQAYAPGLFGGPLDVPDGATRLTTVLARTGRRA